MNSLGRAGQLGGEGDILRTVTVAASDTITLYDHDVYLYVVGGGASRTTSTTVFNSSRILPGRILVLIGTDDTNTVVIAKTAPGSAAKDTVISSANITLGNLDTLTLMQGNSGEWIRISTFDNT